MIAGGTGEKSFHVELQSARSWEISGSRTSQRDTDAVSIFCILAESTLPTDFAKRPLLRGERHVGSAWISDGWFFGRFSQ